jgi:folate-binding protein YgfZ
MKARCFFWPNRETGMTSTDPDTTFMTPDPHVPAHSLSPLTCLGSLLITGADARSFLHGQLTTDVRNLLSGQATPTAWCNANGRVIANGFLLALPTAATEPASQAFRLILARDLASVTQTRLSRYILRSKVDILQEGNLTHWGLSTETDLPALALAWFADQGFNLPEMPLSLSAMNQASGSAASILALPSLATASRWLLSLPTTWTAAWQSLWTPGAISCDAWQRQDIDAGFPWVTAATSEAFVPQMLDFDCLGGVSFDKGCYSGQEVIARARYLGEVKRRLYRVKSASQLAADTVLRVHDEEIGMFVNRVVTPGRGYTALAVLNKAKADSLCDRDLSVHPCHPALDTFSTTAPTTP